MLPTSEELRNLYEAEYADSDEWPNIVNGLREHADRLHFVATWLWDEKAASILDIGCGRGLFGSLSRWTGRSPNPLCGVDVSPSQAKRARSLGYDDVHILDASRPFRLGRTFDVVLCMELLEHVPDPRVVIDNCSRHGRRTMLFSTPVEEGPVDGVIHVRNFGMAGPLAEIAGTLGPDWDCTQTFLPSQFCEKPHWQGWNFVTARRNV